MSDEISFRLFGEGGFINPTPWSYGRVAADSQLLFYDAGDGIFRRKQTRSFDGGWRWFDAYDVDALTIYNTGFDRRAYWHLTHEDLENTLLTPECLLYWVKSMVLVEHNYYTAKNWLEDHIQALSRRVEIEIKKEIRGDDSSHLHPVR